MAGEEKFGYFGLREGTEEEEGCFISRCGWFEFLCVWSWELATDWPSFVCEESGKVAAVKEVVGGGGGGQRREFNVLKRLSVSDALLILLWKYYSEALVVWTSAEKDESKDW